MAQPFSQLIVTEIVAVQRFVALLKQEQAALRDNQLDVLEKLTEEKGTLLEELSRIGQERHQSLLQHGIAENREGVEQWLQAQQNPKLIQAWKALQQLAREAKTLNELNGQCIALLSNNNRQLLETLTGQHARGTFYGPDGQTSFSSGFRISDSV